MPAAASRAPAAGSWKADVRSLVKDFAQEERARGKPGAPRPPRAPPASAPSGGGPAGAAGVAGARDVGSAPAAVKSKKERAPVDYTPATVEEYKNKYGAKGEKTELGRIGPDLDDEGLLMKKAVQEKVKQFSKELHRINRQRNSQVPAAPKPVPKPDAAAVAKAAARAKALEFAQNVPKPKPKPQPKQAPLAEKPKVDEAAEQEKADLDEIRQRERQHFQDVARARQIEDFLKQLPG